LFLGYFGFFWDLIGFFFYYMVELYYFRKKIGFIRFIWITFFWIPLGLGVFFGLFWYFFGVFFWVILRFFGIKSNFWYYTIDFFSSVLPLGQSKGKITPRRRHQEIHTFSLGNTKKYQEIPSNFRKYYEIPGNTRQKHEIL
jgi:hypothetical protein